MSTSLDVAERADRVLGLTTDVAKKEAPGGQADVQISVRRSQRANVRFARNGITTSGESDEPSVGIWVGLGNRHASVSSNQVDDESIRRLAERAIAMAKLAPEDPERMPLLPPQKYEPAPSAWDDAIASMSPADRAALAARAIGLGKASNVLLAGFLQRDAGDLALRTSSGLAAATRATLASYSLTARTPDATGSGWAGRQVSRMRDLDDASLTRIAIDKAVRSANPKPLAPGKYTVILEPQALAELLGFFLSAMDARSADEGRSFFSGKLGQKLFPESVTITSNPFDPDAPSSPFDDEGLALHPMAWVDRGRVNKFSVSRYWAQKTGTEPTGEHATYLMAGGRGGGIDDLVRKTKRGLLVTRFWYTRWLEPQSLMLTGLTRDGVFLVEDGKITRPVQNFRYNESPVTVLKNLDEMTKVPVLTDGPGGIWRLPAVRTNEFTMASTSAAV